MKGLNRILLIVAAMAIIWHIYENGFTYLNVGAIALLVFSRFMEVWGAKKRAQLEEQYRRDKEAFENGQGPESSDVIDVEGQVHPLDEKKEK